VYTQIFEVVSSRFHNKNFVRWLHAHKIPSPLILNSQRYLAKSTDYESFINQFIVLMYQKEHEWSRRANNMEWIWNHKPAL